MNADRVGHGEDSHIVVARGLTKDYGSFRAVDGVDFEIRRGECFGFLGPNGAGKTTVMRIIHCFVPPTSGSVTVLGMDVVELPSPIKARLGVMPQEDSLDPDLTVLENLVVYARYFDIPKRDALALARQLLAFARDRLDLLCLRQGRGHLVLNVPHERLDRGEPRVPSRRAVSALGFDIREEVKDQRGVELLKV